MLASLVFILCMKVSAMTGHRAPANADICAGGTDVSIFGQYFWTVFLAVPQTCSATWQKPLALLMGHFCNVSTS